MKTQGRQFATAEATVSGELASSRQEMGPDATEATWADGPVVLVSYAAGRTIPMAQYEFCRVGYRVQLGVQRPEDREAAEAAAREIVLELVEREAAACTRQAREAGSLPDVSAFVRRQVGIEYGLTLKGAQRFEMHRVDVGIDVPVSDGADFEAALRGVSESITERIAAEQDRIRGLGATEQP